jgi:hypothetical protein
MALQISYGPYKFHAEGIPNYGVALAPENTSIPLKTTQTYKVKQRFFEGSFADNEARLGTLKSIMAANPRAQLLIVDERGSVLVDANVKFAGLDVPDEWGQYRREVTVSFECFANLRTGGLNASFTPDGALAIPLPNVAHWEGGMRVERYSEQRSNRKTVTETVSCGGKVLVDPTMSEEEKRDYLLAQKIAIEGLADVPEGVLCFGTWTKTVRCDSIRADLGDTQEELVWQAQFSRWEFPDGQYAEIDYEVDTSDDPLKGERSISVTGRVLADTEADAESAALGIKAQYGSAGRILVSQSMKSHDIAGGDGVTTLELNFSFRFREPLDLISYELKVDTRTDRKSGNVTTVYSGTVHAGTAGTALQVARALGYAKAAFMVSYTEDVETIGESTASQPGEGESQGDDITVPAATIFTQCSFSYEYMAKIQGVKFAQISMEYMNDRFGVRTMVVSGYVTAQDWPTACAYARTFKLTGGVITRSEKETKSQEKIVTDDGTGGDLFGRVDFSYSYAASSGQLAVSYGIDTENDYTKLEQTVVLQGACYGPTLAQCREMIATLKNTAAPGASVLLRDRENDQYEQTPEGSILKEVSFSMSWETNLSNPDAVLEAEYCVETSYPVWKAQIDEIPYGTPYVQEAVCETIGTISVTGSVTAGSAKAANDWANDKRQFVQGYLDTCQMRCACIYPPLNPNPARYRTEFTFSARTVSLTVQS